VSPEDGFYAWDIGFLWLSPDCLVYQGERAAFSLSREMMNGISIQKGPLAWRRTYGVMISCANGSIGFSTPDRWASRWNARKLRKRLEGWHSVGLAEAYRGRPAQTVGSAPLLPAQEYLRGWRAVRAHLVKAAMLWLGLSILMPFSLLRWTMAVAFVPFMTPLAYLVAVGPTFFRKKPEVQQTAGRLNSPQSDKDVQDVRKEDATPVPR